MLFPFPDDIGALLRAQFTHDRLATTSRNLGNSSITKGEGSLELRLTDDGPAQVAMGDLPDGGFGLGVLSAGQLVSIQSWVQAQIAATTQVLSDRLSAVETRMSSAEGRLDSHESRIGAAETAISGLQSRMTTAEGRLDSHVSRIGALENRVDAAENQITGTKAKNTEQDVRLNKIDNRLDALDGGGSTIPP